MCQSGVQTKTSQLGEPSTGLGSCSSLDYGWVYMEKIKWTSLLTFWGSYELDPSKFVQIRQEKLAHANRHNGSSR